jgi:hypothetical protein
MKERKDRKEKEREHHESKGDVKEISKSRESAGFG